MHYALHIVTGLVPSEHTVYSNNSHEEPYVSVSVHIEFIHECCSISI